MLGFGGFDMPVQYSTIFAEHMATRRNAGLFDVSHMGRFLICGSGAAGFLQSVTTNNVLALGSVGKAQYTLIPDHDGGAVDDAYLYRTGGEEYLLVVNAANREKDRDWLEQFLPRHPSASLEDQSDDTAMLALQGPHSERVLQEVLDGKGSRGRLPEPVRNAMSTARLDGADVVLSRTGYTGEAIGFEIFADADQARRVWELLFDTGSSWGIVPVGLGARDTLRLEAGFPLYGHELGEDPTGKSIPICATALGRRSTSFAESKGDYVGREALWRQHEEVVERLRAGGQFRKPMHERVVPRFVRPVALLSEPGGEAGLRPARAGQEVWFQGALAGWVTSGTIVPYVPFSGSGLAAGPGDEQARRAIALAYIDSTLVSGKVDQVLDIQKPRGAALPAIVVDTNLRAAPPFARPVIHPEPRRSGVGSDLGTLDDFLDKAVGNTLYRQTQAANLIPSEQTPSPLVRLLSVLDPAGRYAEHRAVKAFGRAARDIYYYQGTRFIDAVETAVQTSLQDYLGCKEAEVRCISGQMANKAVFAGLVDYTNRYGKGEPQRLNCVMNNHLGRGGHLSAQYMGALRHFVRQDPVTEAPALVPFPVLRENPYRIDVEATLDLIERRRPDLVIFGKSLVLHPEPIREVTSALTGRPSQRPLVMYDMAHVLGLVGAHFQHPFSEGADIVTGSTHKTFFGPQRGIIASNMADRTRLRPLWMAIVRSVFPGDLSNHHLGTLLAMLGACYEMQEHGDAYQRQVLANAKAFASALHDAGVSVEGDPSVGFTETHQVVIRVGDSLGAEVADRLEANNLITNYQALPGDATFSDASGIRMGTQELTRFGMLEDDFCELAELLSSVVLRKSSCSAEVSALRSRFTQMQFCLPPSEALLHAVAGG